jgi:hypothetical protein
LEGCSGVVRPEDTARLEEIKNMEMEKVELKQRLHHIERHLREEAERRKQETGSTDGTGSGYCGEGEVDDRSESQGKEKS